MKPIHFIIIAIAIIALMWRRRQTPEVGPSVDLSNSNNQNTGIGSGVDYTPARKPTIFDELTVNDEVKVVQAPNHSNRLPGESLMEWKIRKRNARKHPTITVEQRKESVLPPLENVVPIIPVGEVIQNLDHSPIMSIMSHKANSPGISFKPMGMAPVIKDSRPIAEVHAMNVNH
jgi:hypothetical protein